MSLSEIRNIDEVEELSVKQLKHILTANFVDFKGCCEKKELLERVRTLWNSKQTNNKKKSKSQFCHLVVHSVSPQASFYFAYDILASIESSILQLCAPLPGL